MLCGFDPHAGWPQAVAHHILRSLDKMKVRLALFILHNRRRCISCTLEQADSNRRCFSSACGIFAAETVSKRLITAPLFDPTRIGRQQRVKAHGWDADYIDDRHARTAAVSSTQPVVSHLFEFVVDEFMVQRAFISASHHTHTNGSRSGIRHSRKKKRRDTVRPA